MTFHRDGGMGMPLLLFTYCSRFFNVNYANIENCEKVEWVIRILSVRYGKGKRRMKNEEDDDGQSKIVVIKSQTVSLREWVVQLVGA